MYRYLNWKHNGLTVRPGVGISNLEVRSDYTKLARMYSSDHRIRLYWTREDNGQNEGERTKSAIQDSFVGQYTGKWKKDFKENR